MYLRKNWKMLLHNMFMAYSKKAEFNTESVKIQNVLVSAIGRNRARTRTIKSAFFAWSHYVDQQKGKYLNVLSNKLRKYASHYSDWVGVNLFVFFTQNWMMLLPRPIYKKVVNFFEQFWSVRICSVLMVLKCFLSALPKQRRHGGWGQTANFFDVLPFKNKYFRFLCWICV